MKLFLDKVTILLRHHREAAGLSQQQVAEALKVGLRSYQRYESGESTPSIDIIFLLSKILRFDMKTFFAPHELENSLPGFKLYQKTEEQSFKHEPFVQNSKLLEVYNSAEFGAIAESGDVKRLRELPLFQDSIFPLMVSNPKSTLINTTAQKLLGFSSDIVPTMTGHDDPTMLGIIWTILMDHETAFFTHEETTEFPKGKTHWKAKAVFFLNNNNYIVLSAMEVLKAPSKH